METKNILIAGVGGQGLVLATKIISEAAVKEGYDIKTNDVIGLSQRGGKVWGSVRIGKEIHSPNIPVNEGDIILGMEPVEGYRYSHILRNTGTIIMNTHKIASSTVQQEKEVYPENINEVLSKKHRVIEIDAFEIGKKLKNPKIANIVLIGILAKLLDISKQTWEEVITQSVPKKYINENIEAFNIGYDFV